MPQEQYPTPHPPTARVVYLPILARLLGTGHFFPSSGSVERKNSPGGTGRGSVMAQIKTVRDYVASLPECPA